MSKDATGHDPRASVTSAEFRLVVQCCRSAFTDDELPTLRDRKVDWSRFVRLVRFHRVQGLAWKGLGSSKAEVPPEAAKALAADAQLIAATNLVASEEARKLLDEFNRRSVPLLFVKGLTVGALAYPRPLLKMGWDIDILIDRADLTKAVAALGARGFRRMAPPPPTDLEHWHLNHKESVWEKRDQRLYVELHTRLTDNASLLPRIGMQSPQRLVVLASGTSLPTLEDDDLFAYLCVHGASSLWFRLKWITDLAAILHQLPAREIERAYRRSQQLGAGRASAQALLHADDLYGTLAGTGLRPLLERDRASRWLARAAMRQVAGRVEPREPTSSLLGTLEIHLSQLLLLPGLGFKVGELSRQMRAMMS